MTKMNCLYRLILGKPLSAEKKKVEKPPTSPNPILTIHLLNTPLPNTLEELNQLEQAIAKRMSAINAISNSLHTDIQRHIERGQHTSARNVLGRRSSLRSDIRQLSTKLMEIQQKREHLVTTFH